jgi:signal transduction histidine kinase
MSGFGRLSFTVRRHPYAVDFAMAGVLYAVTLLVTAALGPRLPGANVAATTALPAGAACGALVCRRRWPVPVLVVTMIGAVAYLMLSRGQGVVMVAAPMIALYTVAETSNWRRSLAASGLTVLVLGGAHLLLLRPDSRFGPETVTAVVAVAALGGLAVAAGDAARNRRAYIAEVEDRARRAERSREQEANRRVTEERLRLARDLHDVLGHQIALINVQAGVVAHVLDDQPETARQALAQIRQACRSALGELRDTVGLLRQPGDPSAPTEPTVGLWALAELVASCRASGLQVEQQVEGEAHPVPPAADLAAYRVVQESLTNVRKHAGHAAATVRLCYEPTELRIVVEDDGNGVRGPDHQGGAGHGIAGMRERVAAVGGSLEAGPRPGRGFRVSATLPMHVGSST